MTLAVTSWRVTGLFSTSEFERWNCETNICRPNTCCHKSIVTSSSHLHSRSLFPTSTCTQLPMPSKAYWFILHFVQFPMCFHIKPQISQISSEVWGLPVGSQRSGGHRDVTRWGPGGMRCKRIGWSERVQNWEWRIPSWYIPWTFMNAQSHIYFCVKVCVDEWILRIGD